MQELLKAFMLIFVAEMGDKTQILAMAFATRYPVRKVLLGIGIGAFLNHGLAVALGSYLSRFVPINTIQMIAGAAFIGFALWTLKSEDEEETEESKSKYGPVLTVALAFFLGELGDKTQLTAITLAADAKMPLIILAGTVLGMIATGALGIVIGKKLGDKVPEFAIKLIAATVFLFFGLQKLFQTVPETWLKPVYVVPFLLLLAVTTGWMIRNLLHKRKMGIHSALAANAQKLQAYYLHMQDDIERICLGYQHCGVCKEGQCPVKRSKSIIAAGLSNAAQPADYAFSGLPPQGKPFSEDDVLDSLADTLELAHHMKTADGLSGVHTIRKQLEIMWLGKQIDTFHDLSTYLADVRQIDEAAYRKINGLINIRKPVHERIFNLGGSFSNSYLVAIQDGYILIDTGYKEQYKNFLKQLQKNNIALSEIRYVFLTHAHDDHAGFLNPLLEASDAKVILHSDAVDRLKAGQNSFQGSCSSLLALFACYVMKLFGKGKHQFDVVNKPERYLVVTDSTRKEIEAKVSALIISLPGHTSDSMGLLLEKDVLFCGDAVMNGIPSIDHVIIWIENRKDYRVSWETMMHLDCRMIYPAHGKPFAKSQLQKAYPKLSHLPSYPLR